MRATQTERGPMYITPKSDVRIAIKEKDGLIDEITLLISEPKPADTVRFETAAAYLTAHVAGRAESEIASGVTAKAREMENRKTNTIFLTGDTVAFFQYINGGYLVVIGNRRCD